MERDALLDQVRSGMRVDASDGKRIGKIRQVHLRESEVYVEVETAVWLKRYGVLFLPPDTVDTVAGGRVTLIVDKKTAKGYNSRPRWIPEEIEPIDSSPG